jgi:hypothetical protein
MFDAKIDMKDIEKKYSWQAVKRVEEKLKDEPVIKNYIGKYSHFAKIVKINKMI